MLALLDQREPFVPTDAESLIAKEAVEKLKPVAAAGVDVKIRVVERAEIVVPLPARAVALIVELLKTIADGKSVSLIPYGAEMTTNQAADFLNVSRPFVVGLLEKNEIPYRKVGSHRRILMADLLDYKKKSDVRRRAAIGDMVAHAQRNNLP
jgi:excisionase family DNA binding protein